MYLAKLILDPRDYLARRDISDAYQMHRTLSRAFVERDKETVQRFLWRLEAPRSATEMRESVVLIQSATPGAWEEVCALEGYRLDGQKEIEVERLLHSSKYFSFRVLANPTVTRDGKRYGLAGEEAQQAWLLRQGERAGFSLEECVISGNTRLSIQQARLGNKVTIDTVRFDGVLTIRDPASMERALAQGLGHAKAFGLGLLSIAPLRM